jgi:hypothetical protein
MPMAAQVTASTIDTLRRGRTWQLLTEAIRQIGNRRYSISLVLFEFADAACPLGDATMVRFGGFAVNATDANAELVSVGAKSGSRKMTYEPQAELHTAVQSLLFFQMTLQQIGFPGLLSRWWSQRSINLLEPALRTNYQS